jgi:hypothetical protein
MLMMSGKGKKKSNEEALRGPGRFLTSKVIAFSAEKPREVHICPFLLEL